MKHYRDKVESLTPVDKDTLTRAYAYRGLAYHQKGEQNRAIEDLNKSLELKPDFGWAYGYRGMAYFKKGELDLAIKDFTKVMALEPNRAELADAYYHRGLAYANKGEVGLALKDYSRAIELSPYYAEAHNQRALIYCNTGDFDKAIDDFSQAILGNSVNGYYHRGIVWLRLQEWENARADFARAKRKQLDIIAKFRREFGSVPAFERDFGVSLPEDIAKMLTEK